MAQHPLTCSGILSLSHNRLMVSMETKAAGTPAGSKHIRLTKELVQKRRHSRAYFPAAGGR